MTLLSREVLLKQWELDRGPVWACKNCPTCHCYLTRKEVFLDECTNCHNKISIKDFKKLPVIEKPVQLKRFKKRSHQFKKL